MTKKVFFWMLIILVLAAAGGAGALQLRLWDPFFNPLRPSPEQVIGKAFLRLKEVRTFHVIADLDSLAGKNIHVTGDVNVADPQNIVSAGIVDFSEKSDDLFLKAQYKIIGQDAYVSIIDSNVTWLGVDAKTIKGQWIKLPIPGYAFFTDIKEKMASTDSYTIKSRLPDENLGGQTVYRYLVALHADALKNMMGEINLELSIGSQDYYTYGVAMEKRIDFNTIYPVGGDASLYLGTNFSQFNKAVIVKPPASFRNLEEVFR